MQIGPYVVENPLILAPMAGVTDLPFRKLCKQYGAAMAISEMLTSDPALWKTQKSIKRMDHHDEPGVKWVQIVGSDPEQLAKAAVFNQQQGAQIIDINMGCPAKKVCNKASGSALMANPVKVEKILNAVVSATDVPITLKIRTGTDLKHKNALEIAKIAQQSGIQALTIHGRTKACKFVGPIDYEIIAQVKREVSIPVIANGDINTPEQALNVLNLTQADALMIGRAAQGRPWIFAEINHYLNTRNKLPVFSLEKIGHILLTHVTALHQFYGEVMGVRISRKHLKWYLKNHPQSHFLIKIFNQLQSCSSQIQFLNNNFIKTKLAKAG